jgi:release factor glutamine methyltransferase
VFSPKNTISTKVFLDYISDLDLQQKTILELGCGSGIISLFSASKGAVVTSSDINKVALQSLEKVSNNQHLNINCVYSDLFSDIETINFDYIFINPPYYPKTPKNIEEQAWFCGENFDFFKVLFSQLKIRSSKHTLMILSNDCDLEKIHQIASENDCKLTPVFEKKLVTEKNFIFKLQKSEN